MVRFISAGGSVTMEPLREKIINKFQECDHFKYATWEPVIYDEKDSIDRVNEALNFHCPNSTISNILFQQLVRLNGSGMVKICGYNHPYEITDILWAMERVAKGEVQDKVFGKKGSLLANRNIYHIHHSQAFYSMMNCIRYFKKKYKNDAEIINRLSELKDEHPNNNDLMIIFAREIMLQSFDWEEKTGEWLVYQKLDSNINFLCLYVHDYDDSNDEKLYSIIKGELARS